MEAFESVLRASPDNVTALANLGMGQFMLQRYAEARSSLERARELAPEHPHVHLFLGRVHALGGNVAEAEARFRSAVELAPWMGDVYVHWIALLERTGRPTEADRIRALARSRGVSLQAAG